MMRHQPPRYASGATHEEPVLMVAVGFPLLHVTVTLARLTAAVVARNWTSTPAVLAVVPCFKKMDTPGRDVAVSVTAWVLPRNWVELASVISHAAVPPLGSACAEVRATDPTLVQVENFSLHGTRFVCARSSSNAGVIRTPVEPAVEIHVIRALPLAALESVPSPLPT